MTKRQVINQFLFEEGQDAYKYGIGASSHLLVDKHEGIAKYGKKPVTASIRQMPQLVSWSLPFPTNLLYLFKRDDTVYALAENPNNEKQMSIIEFDSDGGYAVKASIDDTQRDHLIAFNFCSCQCGDYEFILMRVLDGSQLLAYNVSNNTLVEITLPKSGAIKATSICYWAGHLFLNDENNDKVWYSSIVLTASDITQIFSDSAYRQMGYKDGNSLWVGVLNGSLWSISSSYIQKWTDSDSTLVPIYADTSAITEMHTFKALPYVGGVLLSSSDMHGIKHLYQFEGKELVAIETEELENKLNQNKYPNAVMLASFETHPLLIVQFSDSTYAYDASNGLWVTDAYWGVAIQVIQDVGLELGSRTRVSKVQTPNPGQGWSRIGSIWLDGNVDFYCDRIALKVRATNTAAQPKFTVRYRMRSLENGTEPDWITESFTLPIGNSEVQCMNCGYGNILDLHVVGTGAIELYDVRAEITGGGRW